MWTVKRKGITLYSVNCCTFSTYNYSLQYHCIITTIHSCHMCKIWMEIKTKLFYNFTNYSIIYLFSQMTTLTDHVYFHIFHAMSCGHNSDILANPAAFQYVLIWHGINPSIFMPWLVVYLINKPPNHTHMTSPSYIRWFFSVGGGGGGANNAWLTLMSQSDKQTAAYGDCRIH